MLNESSPRQREREIRVFISSTFRDMQEEREELVKRVFPKLRKLCEERGVTWGEVDLRWGITEEQAERGEVLPLCLAEIRRCRPYFIGILGERYGWVPDAYPEELLDQQPWLEEHLQHSITELEILHGVLNDPQMADHAYFYFRDPAYVDSLAPELQGDFREGPTEEEIEIYGFDRAQQRAEARREKLEALKARIRKSDFPVREDYANPVELGKWVLEDLTSLIDRLYPEGEQPNPLDRQAAEHEAFAASRAGVYVGRQATFERLDAHARGDGEPLVVLGGSGCGKSALLANWALRYREKHPEEFVLMHFIGASPYSADWRAMLRRILGELKRHFDIEGEIPGEADALRATFANWLHMAATRGRVVLILDALNRLEDREGARDLVWLPPEIPENVRLVVSTLPGPPLDALQERGWPSLNVAPLTLTEREQLIEEYLAQYSKTLSPDRVERIAAAPQTASPLYLRTLLEELRVFGVYERLGQRIDHYLEADSVPTLYQSVLARYENDYERDRPGLVGEAMSLLWAARRGLSEAELLELLGSDGQPLPRAYWSPLYLAAEGSVVDRAGLIGFSHDYLRQAVRDRYLPTQQKQRAAHERLADYFAGRDLGPRKIDELPWQLAQAERWQRLYDQLSDLGFFRAAWGADHFEVRARWAQVEANPGLRLVEAYRPVLDRPAQNADLVWGIASLLHDAGYRDEALSLREYQVDTYRRIGDRRNLHAALGNLAVSLRDRGELTEAMKLHKEDEAICRQLGDEAGLASALGNQAVILRDRGDLDAALALHEKEERICRRLGNEVGLAISLGNQGLILHDRGDPHAAMALHREEERIYRQLGHKAGLQRCLGNQAVILRARGDLTAAMALHQEEERICRELGARAELQASLGNQATILYARGDLDGAMTLMKEQESIFRELGDRAGLVRSLGNQAVILQDRGELDRAMALHKEEERICRELGDKAGLQASIGNQANILRARGDLDGAMRLHREKERICRELGNQAGLATSLGNQANILYARGDLDGAMALHKEKERICRKLGDKAGLQASLGNQALIFQARGDLDGAMVLLQEQERICRELGNKAGLQASLANQANIYYARGDRDKAMALHKEGERICRQLGDKAGLARSLANQANILCDRGDLKRATALLETSESIFRELDDKAGLQGSLGIHAVVLQARGDLTGAVALLREKERICRELGDQAGLATSLANQAACLAKAGSWAEALRLAEEGHRLARRHGLTALARQIKSILDALQR